MTRGRRGFTLLEVVVALAILAMGLMAVADVVGGALRNHVRAHQLDVATLLARGKLVELEDHYDEEGFKDFDEDEEGSFEDQGHPEIRWALLVKRPDLGGSNDTACTRLLGENGLAALRPGAALSGAAAAAGGGSQASGPQSVNPLAGAIDALVKAQCSAFAETMKKGLRELKLTVSWTEGKHAESFEISTHLVVITPRKGLP